MIRLWCLLGGLMAPFCVVFTAAQDNSKQGITAAAFEKQVNGKSVKLAVLRNKKGVTVAITNFGARLVAMQVPGKNGALTDVVVGFNTIDGFLGAKGSRSHGAVMGRYANRIAGGKFTLGDESYQLEKNNNGNNIHGGPMGFNEQVWEVLQQKSNSVTLSYFSKDGESGFPGNLRVTVKYTLTKNNELEIAYTARTDKRTVINLTNHTFFNLNGSGSITGHEIFINADRFTPVDATMIPTGELRNVKNTPFDYRVPAVIASKIDRPDKQLELVNGYDHNYVLNGKGFRYVASAYSRQSGIIMKTYTTEPGLQFFTANGFKGLDTGKDGNPIDFREAFCFETQHFPDAPNHAHFPSTVLNPGEKFSSKTVYRFEVVK